jgi:hypothetical protein
VAAVELDDPAAVQILHHATLPRSEQITERLLSREELSGDYG